jgi:hypothetical protein
MRVILANAHHQPLDRATVEFIVPEKDAIKGHG